MDRKPKGARSASFDILNRVEAGAYADILLETHLTDLSEADAALATEITNGVLRWRMRLDFSIDAFASIKTRKLERRVLSALRIGAYQLLFLDRVPPSAAINESVELVKPEGARKAGFVNAVLRKLAAEKGTIAFPSFAKDPVGYISKKFSHPEWIVRRWVERYGLEETVRLCEANQAVPPKVLRANTLVVSRERLMEELTTTGFSVEQTAFSPEGVIVRGGGRLNAEDPRYYIQDEGSQLIARMLCPRPGETMLDACSAPGGKTTHIAELMENKGKIYAIDKYEARLKSVNKTAARLGVNIIETVAHDAAAPFEFIEAGSMDAILCDAPCSGLGVLRRSPDIKYRRKPEDITELSKLQASILDNIAGYLKSGGRLIYSTCTFEPEETDNVVEAFLSSHPEFALENAAACLPESCKGQVDANGFLRLFPHRHGTDGFFAARMRKS